MGFFNEGTKSLLKTHYNVKVETNMLSRRTKKKKKAYKEQTQADNEENIQKEGQWGNSS